MLTGVAVPCKCKLRSVSQAWCPGTVCVEATSTSKLETTRQCWDKKKVVAKATDKQLCGHCNKALPMIGFGVWAKGGVCEGACDVMATCKPCSL